MEILLAAILMVESGGNDRAVGDGGLSRGPYQIQGAYWSDAVEQLRKEGDTRVWDYDRDVWDRAKSEEIVRAYWRRYAPAAYKAVEAIGSLTGCQILARIHNGGPKGFSKQATLGYWRRVEAGMETLRKGK